MENNNSNLSNNGNNGNNGNTILLTVIGVATLLVALVGATFAYFTASVNNENAQSVTITTITPVGLVYTGKKITMDKAEPGYKISPDDESAVFTVTNPEGDSSHDPNKQTYDLTLKIVTNEFTKTNKSNAAGDVVGEDISKVPEATHEDKQLIWTLSAESKAGTPINLLNNTASLDLVDGGNDGVYKSGTDIVIVDNQVIEIGDTHTYKMGLEFVRFDYPQNNNKEKSFSAYIEISDPQSIKKGA